MFPSARHFAGIDCPFVRWGRCERPYCPFKHSSSSSVCGLRDTGAAGYDHLLEPSGFQNQEANNPCLLELERLNKQIEAVRSEVEKEQRKLSRYRCKQVSCGTGTGGCFKSRPALSKDHNRKQVKYKKTTACKYVVDRTRPKTDLEYDPCSNFSADLRSGSSIDKIRTHKTDMDCDQRDDETGECVCAETVQAPSCSFEDSDEGTLVIDIPPFENGGRHNGSQKQRMATSEAKAALGDGGPEEGPKGLPKKSANITKILGECSERHSTNAGFPLLQKNVEKMGATQNMTNISKFLDSPKSNLVINIPYQESDLGKPKLSSVPSGDGHGLGIRPLENEKRAINQEPESSRKVFQNYSLPVENSPRLNKGSKSPTAIKDETKKLISKQLVTMTENLLEPNKNAVVSESVQVCCVGKPLSAGMKTYDAYEERGPNVEHVLDDISICLGDLRSEGESVACLQDVEDLLANVPDCSKAGEDVFSQPGKICEHGVIASARLCSTQPNNFSGCSNGAEPFGHTHSPQETLAFQEYLPNTSSFPALSRTSEPALSSSAFGGTYWSPAQSVLPQAVVQNMPECISVTDFVHIPPAQSVELLSAVATPEALTRGQTGVLQKPFASVASGEAMQIPSSAVTEKSNNGATQVCSSSSGELSYSDFDLSETDPVEECYNIFMEANKMEDMPVQGDVPQEASKMPEADASLQLLPAQKKRVAHVAKFEQVSKSKAQVIVPLRQGGSQLPLPNQTQQYQRRAVALPPALKGWQSITAASVPRGTPRATPSAPVLHPSATVLCSSPAAASCVSILPVGTTLRLHSDLHLIVPEGNCTLPITLIPATLPVPRLLAPPATSTPPVLVTRAIPTKRKAKGRVEVGVKVPHDVRQRYVNLFVEEFLKTSATVQDAFEKALAEEKTVFDRSVNKLKYLSIAVNALKRLKSRNASAATSSSERNVEASRGNMSLNTRALLGDGAAVLYDQLKEHVLTEALLRDNNFPRKHPDKAGCAIQYGDTKKGTGDAFRRICCRCGTTFSVNQTGRHTRKEECNYHSGKVMENRVPGGAETRYSCCESAVGTPGCQVFKLHVHDAVSLQDFVSSFPQTHAGSPGVYAIATEMSYTTHGLELVRVTVVNGGLQVIYDTFVKPNNEVIDYNTRFSGVSEDEVKSSRTSLRDVQAVLLSFINERTILVGHCLENDLCALKLVHSTVVDTALVFPHRLGPPHKRKLSSLTAETLRRIIQEGAEGRDSQEDAVACMELMLWKVKEDSKVKRW